jgi:translation initiation factor 5B
LGNDLDEAVAGSELYVYQNEDQLEEYSKLLLKEFDEIKKKMKLSKQGVVVMASTLGSLEALLNYLKSCKVPVSYINIGNVTRDDVIMCLKSISNDDITKQKRE